MKQRCFWVPQNDELYKKYHDEEWGVPVHDDTKWFEHLLLENFQAGLSWKTILYKRENFRQAFAGFDPLQVAGYEEPEINVLLNNSGIIRNKLKINAAIYNAKMFLNVQEKYGSFNKFMSSLLTVNHLSTFGRKLIKYR